MTTENNTTSTSLTLLQVYEELDKIFLAYDGLQSLIGSSDGSYGRDSLFFLFDTLNKRLETLKNSISY